MQNHSMTDRPGKFDPYRQVGRFVLGACIIAGLVGCVSFSDRSNGAAAQEQAVQQQRAVEQAAAARSAEARARIAAAEVERERQEALARQEEEQRVQAVLAAEESQRQLQQQQLQQQELAARAQAETDRRRQQEQLHAAAQRARIAELEAEIAATQVRIDAAARANGHLERAVATAEELLEMLATEQAKYASTNANGEPLEPLQKDVLEELESRKDSLKREAQALMIP